MATSQTVDLLASVDLFDGLAPKVLKRIVDAGETDDFAPGAVVLSQGDTVTGFKVFSRDGVNMHVVLEGVASVEIDGASVNTLGPGEYFGELSLIDGEPRSADVIGQSGLTTFALSNWAFAGMLEDHPEVAVPMLKVLCARLRRAEASAAQS